MVETEDLIIKDRITTRTKIKIKEDTGMFSEVTIVEEVIIEETITVGTIVDIIQKTTTKIIIFKITIIKTLKRQETQGIRKDTLRQQLFHKKFAFHVVILITHREIVKREAEAVQEVDKSR